MVTVDVVGLYPSIPHAGLEALRKRFIMDRIKIFLLMNLPKWQNLF